MSYYDTESYAHRCAKQVLAEWFRSRCRNNLKYGNKNQYHIFDWDVRCNDPNLGVYEEYPILTRKIAGSDREYLGVKPVWCQIPDTTKELKNNLKIATVIDVVICDNDQVKYGLEVVYKHPCEDAKIKLLKKLHHQYGIKVYEISAIWILDQIRRPNNLRLTEIT